MDINLLIEPRGSEPPNSRSRPSSLRPNSMDLELSHPQISHPRSRLTPSQSYQFTVAEIDVRSYMDRKWGSDDRLLVHHSGNQRPPGQHQDIFSWPDSERRYRGVSLRDKYMQRAKRKLNPSRTSRARSPPSSWRSIAANICKNCDDICAMNNSFKGAICSNTYHMGCVRPPLSKQPSRGVAWACGFCSRAQEKKLEGRRMTSFEGSSDEEGDGEDTKESPGERVRAVLDVLNQTALHSLKSGSSTTITTQSERSIALPRSENSLPGQLANRRQVVEGHAKGHRSSERPMDLELRHVESGRKLTARDSWQQALGEKFTDSPIFITTLSHRTSPGVRKRKSGCD